MSKLLFETIQFNIIYLFAFALNVKHFYLTHRWDPIRCYHSGSERTREQWQWRSITQPHYPWHSLKVGSSPLQRCSQCILQSPRIACSMIYIYSDKNYFVSGTNLLQFRQSSSSGYLRRKSSRLVPDSRNIFVTILLYLVLSTFLHL